VLGAPPGPFLIDEYIVPLYLCKVKILCYKIVNMSRRILSHLRHHRQRRGLTQEELYKLSGVSRSTIAELESGGRLARPTTTAKLARALKVRPEDLA
jgi:DNA-binding XRE family transcriptional regulator